MNIKQQSGLIIRVLGTYECVLNKGMRSLISEREPENTKLGPG
jgi:hypothetical protein